MCLHISDLTNPTKRWEENEKWTLLVYEEFFVQGEKETELGLPVGDLNSRSNVNLAKSQMGFINFIVEPSFKAFVKFLPKVEINIQNIETNKAKWNSLIFEFENLKESGNHLLEKLKEIEEKEIEESRYPINDQNKKTADVAEFREIPMKIKVDI
jgi:endonuclease III-like uncharacterized protein